MTKKDVEKFDKLVYKTFKDNVNTFQEIIKIFTNVMVQENELANKELMEQISKYCDKKQTANYLTQYFKFSTILIDALENLETIVDEAKYNKAIKLFVQHIITPLPDNKLSENLYGAMDYLIDVINYEYEIASYPIDETIFNTLERVFDGVTPMAQLFMTINDILGRNRENPEIKLSKDKLLEEFEILVSFIIFSNIVRKRIYLRAQESTNLKLQSQQVVNNSSYKQSKNKIYQLKISIKGAKPPIWRRILVKSNITFNDLHNIIQKIFNWENYHLFQFDGYNSYTDEETVKYDDYSDNLYDASKHKISQELQYEKDKIKYIYDFGDDWNHEILLEKILPVDTKKNYPICTAGKRNGPIEDCGGMWGYSEIVYVIENQDFSEAEHLFDDDGNFYYEDFDPAYFNKDEVNARLKRLKSI